MLGILTGFLALHVLFADHAQVELAVSVTPAKVAASKHFDLVEARLGPAEGLQAFVHFGPLERADDMLVRELGRKFPLVPVILVLVLVPFFEIA